MGDLPLLRNPLSKTSRWTLCGAVWELGLDLQSSVSIVLTLPDVADCGGQLFKRGETSILLLFISIQIYSGPIWPLRLQG